MTVAGESMGAVHISPYGGVWYPDEGCQLSALLEERFEESRKRTGPHLLPRPMAMVVPHAAPQYSGTVAAAAYRHLQAADPLRVFILGFSHRKGMRGVAVPDVESYRTPLGDIAVDALAARALCATGRFRLVEEREVCDHSVEIQLPFLNKAAPGACAIPLYVGHLEEQERTAAAKALAGALRPGDILLASSDLTHYGPRFGYVPFPADGHTAGRIRQLDRSAIEAASSVESELFHQTLCRSGATACGSQPISLLLCTLALLDNHDIFQQELDYQTSGEITEDFRESVSYAALGYFRRGSFELSEPERCELLRSAWATLSRWRETGRREIVAPRSLPALARRAPVFVTIRGAEALIGCIGRVFECPPLAETAPLMTLAAALDDQRRPAGTGIPEDVAIEISVLTPMKLVSGADDVRIGRDGAYVECGARSAILLPQAAGAGWTAARFLEVLFRKAHLDREAYSASQGRLHIFQAQVFAA